MCKWNLNEPANTVDDTKNEGLILSNFTVEMNLNE